MPRGDLVTLIEADLGELCAKDLPESDALCHFGWAGTSREQRNDPNVQCENIAQTLCAARLACECGCKVFLGAGSQAANRAPRFSTVLLDISTVLFMLHKISAGKGGFRGGDLLNVRKIVQLL